MITASKLELAKRCPGALALPQSRHSQPEADEGTARHASYEAAIKRGDIPAALAENWPGLTWQAEVKFAYDFVSKTGRVLGFGTDRDYRDALAIEIPGTADAVGLGRGKVVIVDFKSFDPNVPRAAVNPQLHIAALAFARAYDLWEADVAIHHEVRPFDVAELARWDLENFADEVRQIFEDATRVRLNVRNGAAPTLNVGQWCRWCDAYFDCPKQKALRVDVESGAIALRTEGAIPFRDNDEAARAFDLAKQLGMMQKRIYSALAARVKDVGPVPLPDGRVYGMHTTKGDREINGDIGYAVIRELHGQDAADRVCTRSITQKAIEEALRPLVRKGELAKTKEAVMKEIEKRGGVTRTETSKLEAHVPKPAQLKEAG